MKVENWDGNRIRFINRDGEWWAVLSDIAKALDLEAKELKRRLGDEVGLTDVVADKLDRKNHALIVSEFGIYEAIFASRKPQAKEFKRWVFNVIKELRESVGLEVFGLLDKEHQKQAMHRLNEALKQPDRTAMIKANTIANKAVSNKHGYPKMVKKGDMAPDVLKDREAILNDTVELMVLKDKYGLDLSVSQTIYNQVSGSNNQTA